VARPISRRRLLRAAGTTSVAALLAACTTTADPVVDEGADAAAGGSTEPADSNDIARQVIETVGLGVEPTLTPIVATFEVLTGPTGRIPFGVLDEAQQPMLDRDVQLWVVSEGEVVTGPVEPLFYGEGLGQRGIYVAEVELEQAGLFDVVVQVDGGPAGVSAFSARRPEDSTSYPPGAEFPIIATPTEEDPGALESLCTRQPPCSMHQTSLDSAIGAGPVVLTVATPRFCQTAVCGPVVDVLEELEGELDRDDLTFIHAEVYNDAGTTPSQVVDDLALPSEPWTWVIDADGVVVDRFDGPVVPSLVRDAIDRA
jgi:hypothetical protein